MQSRLQSKWEEAHVPGSSPCWTVFPGDTRSNYSSSKNVGNTVDLFDSSTDNVNNPSMFIIFNDIQAYPEYLITFTR